MTVYFQKHPESTVSLRNVRDMNTVAYVADHILQGESAQALDTVVDRAELVGAGTLAGAGPDGGRVMLNLRGNPTGAEGRVIGHPFAAGLEPEEHSHGHSAATRAPIRSREVVADVGTVATLRQPKGRWRRHRHPERGRRGSSSPRCRWH